MKTPKYVWVVINQFNGAIEASWETKELAKADCTESDVVVKYSRIIKKESA